jgi:hypothetical protein
VGPNSTAPSTKIALTTFISTVTYVGEGGGERELFSYLNTLCFSRFFFFFFFSSEIWQSTELALPPYKATSIIGYLMSRPYTHTFPVRSLHFTPLLALFCIHSNKNRYMIALIQSQMIISLALLRPAFLIQI